MTSSGQLASFLAAALAAMVSAGLIRAIRPLLSQHALATPNARSSHRVPTPQGAGIAVVAATLLAAGVVIAYAGNGEPTIPAELFGATMFLAFVGLADDLKSIPIGPRLILQAIAVGAVVFTAAGELRIAPPCPLWIERGLLFLALLWFVNLVNFMDGLDWMTVAEAVPVTGAVVVLGLFGDLPVSVIVVAAALCGAMAGFAPFNRPVAKIFLGDVGSLPIGLLLGWCLLQLAYHHHVAAALLLPLYYLADATVTLLRRLARREPFWAAHRTHFYQRATDNGFTVWRVVSEVLALNIFLAMLAIASALTESLVFDAVLVLAGGVATALLMLRFSQRRS